MNIPEQITTFSDYQGISESFSLTPATQGYHASWSGFCRASSAANIIGQVPVGTFLEIKDRKFSGESLIVIRRGDFERLVKSSRSSSQIKKVLFSIEKTVLTFQPGTDPTNIIQAVKEIASLGVELAQPMPEFSTAAKYIAHAHAAREDKTEIDFELPKTRAELRRGVKKK
ncbi:hypothetical protein WDW86_16715 [Bdellovibrionota bacterium FG-2]